MLNFIPLLVFLSRQAWSEPEALAFLYSMIFSRPFIRNTKVMANSTVYSIRILTVKTFIAHVCVEVVLRELSTV